MAGEASPVLGQFLDYLRYERHKSDCTVLGYGMDLQAFEDYLRGKDEDATLVTADADLVRGWMEGMVDKGNRATSVKRRLSALRTFYRFAMRRGLVASDPARMVRGPKCERPLPQFLREREMDDLIALWEGDGDSYKQACVHAMIMVFYETGIRVSELAGLDDADVDTEARQLRVTGKGDKQRVVPFGDELAGVLRRYREARGLSAPATDGAMFVTEQGRRVTAAQVRYEVKKEISRVSTLRKRTPHVLRHTFATAMLNHGASIESIKKLLGHASVGTTEIYAHTTFEQLKRVYKQAHPRA